MKTGSVLLMALVAGLVACSDGGGGSGNGPKGPTDFEPARKPANAVSKEDLKYYQKWIATSAQHLPQDAAVFTTVLAGSSAESVKPEDYDKAMALLNADGQQVVRMVKARCNVKQASSVTTGDTEMRVGATQIENGDMALIEATGCPLPMTKVAQTNSVITDIAGNANNVNIKSTATATEKTERFVQDDFLRYRTNLLSSSLQMNTTAATDVAFSESNIAMKAIVNGTGTMAYEMVDGDFMRGPITFEANIDTAANKMNVQSLFDLQTSRGAIRVVMIGTEAGQEIYINGEKANPGDFGPMFQATRPMMNEVSRIQALKKQLQ
jgi:hypothetical protein